MEPRNLGSHRVNGSQKAVIISVMNIGIRNCTVYFNAVSNLFPVAFAVTNRAGAIGGVISPRVTLSTAITPI